MNEHLEGRPVHASTYRNWGCRCDGCRAANTQATYKMWRKRADREVCSSDDCERGAYAKGLCRRHYYADLHGYTPRELAPPSFRTLVKELDLGIDHAHLWRMAKKGLVDVTDHARLRQTAEISQRTGLPFTHVAKVLACLAEDQKIAS